MYTTVSKDTQSQHQPRHKKSRRTHTRNAAKKHQNQSPLEEEKATVTFPTHNLPSFPSWMAKNLTDTSHYVCSKWDALKLGVDVGSVALNAYLNAVQDLNPNQLPIHTTSTITTTATHKNTIFITSHFTTPANLPLQHFITLVPLKEEMQETEKEDTII